MQYSDREHSKLVWPHESMRKQFGENCVLGFYNQRKNPITRDVNQGHTKIPQCSPWCIKLEERIWPPWETKGMNDPLKDDIEAAPKNEI